MQGLENHIEEVPKKWSMLFHLGATSDSHCFLTITTNIPVKIPIYLKTRLLKILVL